MVLPHFHQILVEFFKNSFSTDVYPLSQSSCVFCYTQEEVSPLENAVDTVESKNEELQTIITRIEHDSTLSINPLSMTLNGVIDAAVMGGTAKYQEVGGVLGRIRLMPL